MYLELRKEKTPSEIFSNNNSVYYFGGEQFFSKNDTSVIGEFKNINLFIGTNNSGKSRFLRSLVKYEDSYLNLLKSDKGITQAINEIDYNFILINETALTILPNSLDFKSRIINFCKELKDKSIGHNLVLNFNDYKVFFEANTLFLDSILARIEILNTSSAKEKYCDLKEISIKIKNLETLIIDIKSNKVCKKIYIPTLRNLERNNIPNDAFNNVIKENYNIENNVFTGLNFYTELSNLKGSVISKRNKVKEFEKFISNTFFEGKEIEITPKNSNPVTILFSADNNEFPIFDIGDGIQQLILLLFPIFTSEDETWFFIEEPETHLHPGLQRIFVETLLNNKYLKTKKLRYFFTTHSNHFLDLSLQTDDISIFQFQKETQEKFNIKSVKPSRETLDLLGVNNSSVLMANSSIWVEGPTDRKYISKFLKSYCEQNIRHHLKEDIDFAFFEYGGNLIEHYLFDENFDEVFTEDEVRTKINSFALSNKIYLLADNDNAKGKKLARRKKLIELSESEKNFKYQNTNYREIENLLPVKVVKDFLVELVKDSEIDKIETIQFERKDYISTCLGEFIENLFEVNKIKGYKKFRDDSGTLKSSYKTKLCDFVINGDYTYDELIFENKQLDDIIVSLYNFIKPKQ